MIKWTKQMLKELEEEKDIQKFIEKYKMSLSTARNKQREIKKTQSKPLKQVIKNSNHIEIPSIILDIDRLIKEGYTFYLHSCTNEIKKMENAIMDLEHTLEAKDMSDRELVKISKSITECRRVRRTYKNEKQFLENNKIECENFINFLKNLKGFSEEVQHFVYKPRILKTLLGEKIKPTATQNNNDKELSKEVIDRLFNLEKYNLKMNRKVKREKGEEVDIDLLKQNYKDLFFKLDIETREGILKDCESIYSGVDIPQIKEYLIMNDVLPSRLVELKYFLKGEK